MHYLDILLDLIREDQLISIGLSLSEHDSLSAVAAIHHH